MLHLLLHLHRHKVKQPRDTSLTIPTHAHVTLVFGLIAWYKPLQLLRDFGLAAWLVIRGCTAGATWPCKAMTWLHGLLPGSARPLSCGCKALPWLHGWLPASARLLNCGCKALPWLHAWLPIPAWLLTRCCNAAAHLDWQHQRREAALHQQVGYLELEVLQNIHVHAQLWEPWGSQG